MAVTTTGNNPKLLWPGIKKVFQLAYAEYPLECTQVFQTIQSDKAYEEYLQSVGYGLAQEKPQGSAVVYDSDRQGYTYRLRNVNYALAYAVTEEEMDDNQYAEVGRARAARLAFAMRQTKEEVGADVFNNGFDSNFPLGDGVEFFSNAHPTQSGNQSNIVTAGDLSEAKLEDMLIAIEGATDDRGNKISLIGQKLIIPRQERFNAERILESTLQNDTANNATNAMRSSNMLPEGYMVWHYLDDTNAFYVTTNVPSETGLIHQERKALRFSEDSDFNTDNMLHKAAERYAFGVVDWRAAWASAGSS